MEHTEIDRVELLRGLDADERARFLIEWGDPDPLISERFHLSSAPKDNDFSRHLGPDPKPRRTHQQYDRELRFERIYGKQLPQKKPEPEELPATSNFDQPPEGFLPIRWPLGFWPAPSPVGQLSNDWVAEGVHAHLERMKARTGKPHKPYANDPWVTKEQAAANTGNPFTDVRATRSSRLRLDEVTRVYDAMAFILQAYKRRMNAHLTIRWGAMGVSEADAPELLQELLNRAEKWFARNKAGRSCVWAHDALLPNELLWVYVHEKSATYGFHTHVPMSMDLTQAKDFEAWVDRCLAKLVRRHTVPSDTAVLSRYSANAEHYQNSNHWFLCKYITKQLDPDAEVASPFCDKVVAAREVFEPRNLRADLPVTVPRLVGVCRRLDRGAQNEAQYVSRLKQGLQLYNDGPFRLPCLDEERDQDVSVFEASHGYESYYRHLELCYRVPSGDRDVTENSAPQYFAFETAWDRLTEAEQVWEAAKSGKNKVAAGRVLVEARRLFEVAEGIINLDRWGLMPNVEYYEGDQRPKRRFRCSSEVWDQQLAHANLKADRAYEWFCEYLQDVDVVSIVPRERMPEPMMTRRTTRRKQKRV